MNIQLKRFDMKKMGDDKTVVIIARRGAGKSTLALDILYHKRHLPCGVVMSGTEEGNGAYGKHVPDSFVFSEYNKEIMEKVIARQKRMVHENHPNPNTFIVLDDCAHDKTIFSTKNLPLRTIFMNGRHWKIFFLMTLQFSLDMPPALRQNIDYVFVLKENIQMNRERLWRNFFGVIPDFNVFCQILDMCTENYEALVMDNTTISNKIEDVLFWYKAKPRDNFHMGSPSFWQQHAKTYNPRYWYKEQEQDERLGRKKNALKVTVKKTK